MGICVVDRNFELITAPFDIRVNPVVNKQHVGKDFNFPFTNEEIHREKVFGDIAQNFIKYLDSDTLVVGHAFENDARMLIDACHKYGIACPDFDYVDTNMLYNMAKGASGEHSLATLGEEFEIEFEAHDPLEDARATLEIAKILSSGDLLGFMERYKIEPSRVCNNLIYRGGYGGCDELKVLKRSRYNLAFNTSAENSSIKRSYFFDNVILTEQDLSAVAQELQKRSYGFCSTKFSSDCHITNNLYEQMPYNTLNFRKLVKELGLENEKYDFSPKKVYGKDMRPIKLDEYYGDKYAKFEKDGELDGKGVSFTKGIENGESFHKMLVAIAKHGGKIKFNVAESSIFLVEKKSDLKLLQDGRIRFYNRLKKQQVMTLSDFLDKYKN